MTAALVASGLMLSAGSPAAPAALTTLDAAETQAAETQAAETQADQAQAAQAQATQAQAAQQTQADEAQAGKDAEGADQTYTFAFYDMPLIDALDLMSARSGRPIAVTGPAQNAPIDARFVAVTFDKALREILRSRQHVVLSFADGSLEIQLLDAPAGADPAAFRAPGSAGADLGLFPLSDGVVAPEKPQGIGLRPGGISLGLSGGDEATREKAPQD